MDAVLSSGLTHIDKVYWLAEKLIEAKLAPHHIRMGCFLYDQPGEYVSVGKEGKMVAIRTDRREERVPTVDVDCIVEHCMRLGFTSGSVTKEELLKHREVVTAAWRDLCDSLSKLKIECRYDSDGFLRVNSVAYHWELLNLCLDENDNMCVRAQLIGINGQVKTSPKMIADSLNSLYDLSFKEEGEQ